MFDGGSYKYNTTEKLLRYFMGTESHNTIMLEGHDQMLKGDRFIWYMVASRVNSLERNRILTYLKEKFLVLLSE